MSISLKKLIFEAEAPTPPQKGAVPSAPKPASNPPTPPTLNLLNLHQLLILKNNQVEKEIQIHIM